MTAADGAGENVGTKTFVDWTPAKDARAEIPDEDNGDDRSAAGPACPTRSGKKRMPERTLDVPRTWKDAMSDRYSTISLMTNTRTYGPDRDIQALMLAILDDIIQTPKKLRAMTLLSAEQFDYLCVKLAERVAERDLDRLFWDDDLRSSDPGTRSKLYIRHALLLSLLHKKEANTKAVLRVFFAMDQGTASRYLKVVNGMLAKILPTARNLAEIIRGSYERRSGSGGGSGDTQERPGPLSTSGPPVPVAATDDPSAPPS